MASPIKKMAIETPGGEYQEKKIGADAEDITVYKDSNTNTYIDNIEEYSGDPVVTSLPTTLNDLNNKTIDENHGGIGTRGINSTSGGVQNSQAVTTAGALFSTAQSLSNSISTTATNLRNSFQAGVDTIYNAIKNNGVTPASSTPTDCAAGINNIRSGGNATSAQILKNKTAYSGKVLRTGTMEDKTGWIGSGTPTGNNYINVPVPQGYHNGSGYVTCHGETAYQQGKTDQYNEDHSYTYGERLFLEAPSRGSDVAMDLPLTSIKTVRFVGWRRGGASVLWIWTEPSEDSSGTSRQIREWFNPDAGFEISNFSSEEKYLHIYIESNESGTPLADFLITRQFNILR